MYCASVMAVLRVCDGKSALVVGFRLALCCGYEASGSFRLACFGKHLLDKPPNCFCSCGVIRLRTSPFVNACWASRYGSEPQLFCRGLLCGAASMLHPLHPPSIRCSTSDAARGSIGVRHCEFNGARLGLTAAGPSGGSNELNSEETLNRHRDSHKTSIKQHLRSHTQGVYAREQSLENFLFGAFQQWGSCGSAILHRRLRATRS